MKKSILIGLLFLGITGFISIHGQDQYQVASMQYALGEYTAAIKTYEQIDLESEQMNSTELNKLADAYTQVDNLDKAINIYNISLNKDSENHDAYLKLANLYRRVGDPTSSLKVYELYKSIDPVRAQHGMDAVNWSQNNTKLGVINHKLVSMPFNSYLSDYFPTEYKGGLVYSSNSNFLNRAKENHINSKVNDQFYFASDVDKELSASPRHLRSDIQDWSYNSAISYAPDYSWALVTITNKSSITQHLNSTDHGMRIFKADVEENGNLSNLVSFPFNSMDYSNGLAHIMADGKTVLFSSNRKGGYGGYDIYYTTYHDGTWSKAENMGKYVNSAGNEISPSIYNSKLYFSSDYFYGYGGYDLYGTHVEMESGHVVPQNQAVNLGLGINSPSDEFSAAFVKDNLYISSQRSSGKGGSDIYLVQDLAVDSKPVALPVSLKSKKITKLSTKPSLIISKKEHYLSTDLISKSEKIEKVWQPVQLSLFDKLTPAEIEAVATDRTKEIKNIYSVQVAVVSALDGNEVNRLNRTLGDIDQIYKIHFRNQIKIRVGSYDTNSEASRTLNLVKAKGYKDAFIVTEQVIVSSGQAPVEVETPVNNNIEAPAEKVVNNHIPFYPIGQAKYKVRLATYSNPKWFDKSKVLNLGNIQRIDRADWTIFLLGDYDSYEKAQNVKTSAINAGFNQAQVVTLENGIPVKAEN